MKRFLGLLWLAVGSCQSPVPAGDGRARSGAVDSSSQPQQDTASPPAILNVPAPSVLEAGGAPAEDPVTPMAPAAPEPSMVPAQLRALLASSVAPEDLKISADIERSVERRDDGAYRVMGACPGEYCMYGEWQFREPVALRAAPYLEADSVGSLPATRGVCADSGFVLVDPPGVVSVRGPFEVDHDDPYPPPYAVGDTLLLFNYWGEGYWVVQWQDSLILAYAYWEQDESKMVVLGRPKTSFWVHVTDRLADVRGWVRMGGVPLLNDFHTPPCG